MTQQKDRVVSSAKLVWQGAGGAIQEQILSEGAKFVLGREPSCDIVLANKLVSKRHAMIYWEAGGFYIADQNSANGTLVNGQQITAPTPLQDGDRIEIGETVFSYYFLGERLVEVLKTMPLPRSEPGGAEERSTPAKAPPDSGEKLPSVPQELPTKRLVEDLPTLITDAASMETELEGAATRIDTAPPPPPATLVQPPVEAPAAPPPVSSRMTTPLSAPPPVVQPEAQEKPAPPPVVKPETPPRQPSPPPAAPPAPPTGGDQFTALLGFLMDAQSTAQTIQNRWQINQSSQQRIVERLQSVMPRMTELNEKVNEVGLIQLLDKLMAAPTDVTLLVELSRHAGLISRLAKSHFNQEAAINLAIKDLEEQLHSFQSPPGG